MESNVNEGSLHFTSDASQPVRHDQVQFIAVGTSQDEDGRADMQYMLNVAKSIATHMTDYKFIFNKYTVPVGIADKVTANINADIARAAR